MKVHKADQFVCFFLKDVVRISETGHLGKVIVSAQL